MTKLDKLKKKIDKVDLRMQMNVIINWSKQDEITEDEFIELIDYCG